MILLTILATMLAANLLWIYGPSWTFKWLAAASAAIFLVAATAMLWRRRLGRHR
jgi:hypothetical protein